MGNINSFFQKKPKAGRPAKSSNAGRKPAPSPEEPSAGLQPPTAAAMAAAAKAKSVAENLASAATRAISGQVLDAAETAAVARAAAAAAKVPMGKRSRTNWSAPGNVERLSKAVDGWPSKPWLQRTQRQWRPAALTRQRAASPCELSELPGGARPKARWCSLGVCALVLSAPLPCLKTSAGFLCALIALRA